MNVLNIITYVFLLSLSIVAVVTAQEQVESVPNENKWIFVAQTSVRNSMNKVKSYGEENEKIKTIVDEAFKSFVVYAENSLSAIIEQTNKTESEEVLRLRLQFMKWAEELKKFNKVPSVIEKTKVIKALEKFIFTIDFMVNEVTGFDKYSSFKSNEAQQIIEKLKLLLKESATKLVEYAKSVEDQATGNFKIV